MYQRILHEPLKFPTYMSSDAQSLLSAMLERIPLSSLIWLLWLIG
jgi:hypothetical protein